MKLSVNFVKVRTTGYFDNQVDPFIPEWWAMETLAVLYENMIAASLINRDFEEYFNKYGDVVNTRRPREFKGIRKAKGDAVTIQDAIADNIAVTLDQWCTVSFIIDDIDETMSMVQLQTEFAEPAGKALARMVDRMVLGQYPRFFPNFAGGLNTITETNIKDAIIDTRKVLDDNKAYEDGRNLILTTKTEADVLRPQWFTSADKVGDEGTALRTASIGEKFGMQFYKSLNMANVQVGNTMRTFQINNASGYPIGTTAITIDTGSGAITAGTWLNIGGFPYQAIAPITGSSPTTAVTLSYGLKAACLDNDPVLVYTPGAVNLTAGYPAGWNKEITIDGFTVAPQVGQLVSFNTDMQNVYTIIDVNGLIGITLDRSLALPIANNDNVNIGPAGAYNLALHRDAITLAIRGLAPVRNGAGALSSTVNMNGLSMRATISYDNSLQRHKWTLDFLAGIQVLNKQLGAVLLG